MLTDQNHGSEDPDTPIGRQFPVSRPVSIGAGSWLGAGAIAARRRWALRLGAAELAGVVAVGPRPTSDPIPSVRHLMKRPASGRFHGRWQTVLPSRA